MTTRGEVIRGCEPVIKAALRIAADERDFPAGEAVRQVNGGIAGLIHAARDLTALVDDLDPGDVPPSWRRARTDS